MDKKKKKQKPWVKKRHKILRNVLSCLLSGHFKRKYNVNVEKIPNQRDRNFLVLFNHQTAGDQFFVGMAFDKPVYFVATEDLFSMGIVSKVIKFLVEPIPIKKQTADVRAVLNCMKIAKEGGTIALAPEGNRTYSGKPCYIKPSVVSLIKALKLPVVLYRIEGGYGVQPRWSDVVRKGSMRSYVYKILEYEEYSKMTDEELYAEVVDGLYVEEGIFDVDYITDSGAEYLERAIYVCPECGLSEFESKGNEFRCKKCGLSVTYNQNGRITKDGEPFKFETVGEWYDYQNDFVNDLDMLSENDEPLYEDMANIFEVILYKNKKRIDKNVKLLLYKDRLCIKGEKISDVFAFEDTSVITCLGRNKMNIYHKDKVYQFKGSERFCAVKYMNMYHRYKNQTTEVENAKFLGI